MITRNTITAAAGLKHAATVILFWLIASCSGGVAILGEDHLPNIILILTDDQGYPPVGALGHPWIHTPNLDRLYRESARITRFLVSPTCSPTRSALMTGRHPMRNGVTHTIFERERLTQDAVTLPQVLKERGYTTGIFGKWHLGDEPAYQPGQRGFDKTFIHGAGGIGQKYDCSCADVPDNGYFDPVLREDGVFVKTTGYCTDVFFQAAIAWIEQTRDEAKPFFAYISTNAPHAPFHAPNAFKARFLDAGFADVPAGFFGMIENIDSNVGKLLARLEELGMDKDTLVIFMSDNGMSATGVDVGDEFVAGFPNVNAGMKGLKGSTDEGGVRVPFFARWPGHIPAGRDCDIVAAHIDLFPTLVEIAGAKLPENQVEGRSLWKLLQGKSGEWPDRYLVTHTGRWPVGAEPNDYQWRHFAIRSQRFRYVGPSASKAGESKRGAGALFDMLDDPGQTTDVSHEHPDVVRDMESFYDDWWKKTRPMLVNENVPMSPTRPYWVEFEEQKQRMGIPVWPREATH